MRAIHSRFASCFGDVPARTLQPVRDVFALELMQDRRARFAVREREELIEASTAVLRGRFVNHLQRRFAHRDRGFDHVSQLAHIPWPPMSMQLFDHLGGEQLLARLFVATLLEEEIDEQVDVFRPLSQGRNAQCDHSDAVVEIESKLPFVDFGTKVAVGRRNDANVDVDIVSSAHTTEAAALQRTEKVGLQLGRKLTDFVQEDRSAVCTLERADVTTVRSRKRSFFVTEQLAGDEVRRHRCAVDRDEGLVGALAGRVQGPRNEFLARTGLTDDQRTGFRFGGPLDLTHQSTHGVAASVKITQRIGVVEFDVSLCTGSDCQRGRTKANLRVVRHHGMLNSDVSDEGAVGRTMVDHHDTRFAVHQLHVKAADCRVAQLEVVSVRRPYGQSFGIRDVGGACVGPLGHLHSKGVDRNAATPFFVVR